MKTNHIKSTLLAGCLIAASVLLMLPAETAEAVSVTSVSFDGSPPDGQNDTYKLGDTITIKVVFSEAVTVTGAPFLRFSIYADPADIPGSGTARDANYSTGTGTDTLTFTHTVEDNSTGAGMVLNPVTTLQLNGGSIGAGDDTIDRLHEDDQTATGVSHEYAVDGAIPTVTLISSLDSTATTLSGAQRTIFTVEFTFEEVVFGFEAGDILLGNTLAQVDSFAVDPTDPKKYIAKIRALATGVVHVSLPANSVTDAAGNGNRISYTETPEATFVRTPTVGTITFDTTGPYTLGDDITISVPILNANQFSGSPTIVLTVGSTDRTLTATNVTGSPSEIHVYGSDGGSGYRWGGYQSQQPHRCPQHH